MNFVEEAAAQAALEGELSASQAFSRSPTSAAASKSDQPGNHAPAKNSDTRMESNVAQDKEAQIWNMLQNRLDPRVHAQTMGINSPAYLGFGMTKLTMASTDSVDYVLNTATIPKDIEPDRLLPGSRAPKVEITEKRKQWLTQLLEKKKRAAERKAALSQGEPDPIMKTSAETTVEKTSKERTTKKKKRQQDSMSNSEYESDIEQTGVVKFRRTSRSSKVDSSSEVSDVESNTPRSRKAGTRRKAKKMGKSQRSRTNSKSESSAGSLDVSEQSSGDLDEIFDKLHVDSSDSTGEIPHTYSIDHLAFLEDSQNTHRNKGRIGSIDLGGSFNARGLGTSLRLDASLGQSLDDSVRFWEAETSAAQRDLQSFVSGFAEGESTKSDDAPNAHTENAASANVVTSLFDLNANTADDDEQLEKSWLMATDPAALSVGALGSLDLSMMAKSFDANRKSPTLNMNNSIKLGSVDARPSKPFLEDDLEESL